jgi:multiple sugar transport system substrate-binding protein
MRKRSRLFFVITMVAAVILFAGSILYADEKITLTFMSWEASPLEAQSIQKGLDGFRATHPNVEVKYVTAPWSEHHAKLRTMMASGTAPDVFYLNPDYQRDFIKRGQLLDMTDLFNKYYDINDFIPSSREKMMVKVPGKAKPRIFGVDVCVVGPVLFYNKDLFDRAGVPYPPTELSKQWTWDQFVKYMQKLTIVKDGKTIQYGTSNFEEPMTLYTTLELLGSNGAKWFNDDFTKAVGINSPATIDTLQKIKDLRVKYGVSPDPSAIGLEVTHSPTQFLMTGRVASLFMGSYALQELSKSNIKLGAGLPPKMKNGIVPIGSANIDAVWSGTKHPKEAMELVTYLTSIDFGLPIYRSGLWMPNRLSMYTKENINKWCDPKVYPDGWTNMVTLWSDAKGRWFDNLVNADQVYDVTTEELQAYFYENKPLKTVLPRLQKRINKILEQR